jgi:hypothetical protein
MLQQLYQQKRELSITLTVRDSISGLQISIHSETLAGEEDRVRSETNFAILGNKKLIFSIETPGEDSYHLSSYVQALIKGLQGDSTDPFKRVVATCKHFAGYDIENWNGNFRYQFDAQISQQDLVEYYLPSFRSCVDANVGAFMCSYSEWPCILTAFCL